ncbi:gliding motility-associated C-terminal domain-containing protein [Pontibacter chitinilyticus]|uniref:T9SS type B sorting domain-containing protein n=1 Tax=Pontibacter chitinilyticus TaxID=2674989 RepID=UPI00321B5DB6
MASAKRVVKPAAAVAGLTTLSASVKTTAAVRSSLAVKVPDAYADLKVTIKKSPGSIDTDTYRLGEDITYTITVENLGPRDETGVYVNVSVPGALKSASQPTAVLLAIPALGVSTGTWAAGSLASGGKKTLTVVTTVQEASNASAAVKVAGNGTDNNQTNNMDSMFFCIVPDAPGEIFGPAIVCLHKSYTYSINKVPGASFYDWNFPSDWVVEIDPNNQEVAVVKDAGASGKITVAVGNTCGKGAEKVFEVTSVFGKPSITSPIQGKQYPCPNITTTYQIDPVAGATSYTWTVPAGWSIQGAANGTSITVVVGTGSGSVTVTAVNPCGEGTSTTLAVTPQATAPTKPAIIGETNVCQGSSGNIYSIAAIPGVTYTWTVPQDWKITNGDGTNRITVTSGTLEGEIQVVVSNDCNLSATAAIAVKLVPSPPPTPKDISGLAVVCANQKNLVYSIAPVPGASSYRWTAAGWTIVAGQGTTSITINAGSSGTVISVVAINACGVTSAVQLTTVVTNAVPGKPGAITGSTIPCIGKTYIFSIEALSDAANYTWSVPAGWTITAGQGTTSITVTAGSTAGNVSVLATNGCGDGSANNLPVKPTSEGPTGLKAIEGAADVCAGATVTYQVDATANANAYTWEVPQGWTIVAGQNTTQLQVKAGAAGGEISIIAKNDCGAVTLKKAVTVSASVPAKPGNISGETSACSGTTLTYTIPPVSGATTYTWYVPAGWSIVSNQGTSLTVKAGSTAGQIRVEGVNGCGASGAKATLAVAALPGPPAVPGSIRQSAGSFCHDTPGIVFSIDPVPGASTYTWAVPQGWSITAGQGTTSITVTTGTVAGEVTVYGSNSCGQGERKATSVAPQKLPVAPEINMGAADPCIGGNSVYSVTAQPDVNSYTWQVPAGWTIVSGQGSTSITVTTTAAAGSVKVSAISACGEGITTELAVKPVAGVPATTGVIRGPASACAGRSLTYTVDATAHASTYTWAVPQGWTITAGQGTTSVTVTAGNQNGEIMVAAGNGCGTGVSATLPVTVQPLAQLGPISDKSTACVGLAYEVAPVAGATQYIWSVPDGWHITSGQGTTQVTVAASDQTNGSISVVVDNGTCQSEPVSLTPDKQLLTNEVFFPNVFSPNGDGNNDTWAIRNLESYPDNEVSVLNRWGNEVYRSKAYRNDWGGGNLSEGTYYYVAHIKGCDGVQRVYKGYVTIVR